jgi:hypothetical protein
MVLFRQNACITKSPVIAYCVKLLYPPNSFKAFTDEIAREEGSVKIALDCIWDVDQLLATVGFHWSLRTRAAGTRRP